MSEQKPTEVTLRRKPDRRQVPRVVETQPVDVVGEAQRRVLEVFDDLVWGRP